MGLAKEKFTKDSSIGSVGSLPSSSEFPICPELMIPSQENLEPLKERLKNLDADIKSAVGHQTSSTQKNDSLLSETSSAFGLALRSVTEIVLGPVVGGFLGFFLDMLFGSKPLFLLCFFVIGIVSGILNAFRVVRYNRYPAHKIDEN